MKKITKVISVILVISAMLMVTLMPAFAAFPDDAVAYYWITKELSEDYSDGEHTIYKVTMHLQANYPVSIGDLRVYWPKDEFTLLENEPDPDWPCEEGSMAFNYLGAMNDNTRYRNGSGKPEINDGNLLGGSSAYGPGHFDLTPMYPVTSKYFNDAVPQSEYDAVQLAWILGNSNHYFYDSSVWGDEVAEFYLLQNGDASIDDVQTKEAAPLHEVCWTGLDGTDAEPSPESMAAKGHPTLFKTLVFGEPTSSSSIINSYKNQIRFQKDGSSYAEKFDVRTLAKISKEDFNATFGDEATALSKIQKIGFVYANTDAEGEFKMDDVKAYLESGTGLDTGYYVDVPVNTISTAFASNGDGADYVISCLIKNIPDADQTKGVKAVAYIVYEGDSGAEVALYPDVTTTNFQELYNQYYTQAFPG